MAQSLGSVENCRTALPGTISASRIVINDQTGEAIETLNADDLALWLAARELLAAAKLALDYLDGQEYLQAFRRNRPSADQ